MDQYFEELFDEKWNHLDFKISFLSQLYGFSRFSRDSTDIGLNEKLQQPSKLLLVQQDVPSIQSGAFPSCDSIESVFEHVKNGSLAIIHQYTILRFCLKHLISDDFKEDIDFHLSRQSFHPLRLFTQVNTILLNKTLKGQLALV